MLLPRVAPALVVASLLRGSKLRGPLLAQDFQKQKNGPPNKPEGRGRKTKEIKHP